MRVLYFSRDYTAHDHRFLSALAETEDEVLYLRLERQGLKREERPLPAGVREVEWLGGKESFAYRFSVRLMQDLQRVIKEFKPDLIHAGPIQTCAFLTAQAGFSPLVSMSWGSDLLMDADRDEQMTWITQYTLDRTQVFVGDCQAVSDKAQSYGFPLDRIKLFPWGIDLHQFQPGQCSDLRAALGWQENPVFLSLRAWEPIYGVDVLIQGFEQAVKENKSIRLLLLGGGSLEKQIFSLIKDHALEPYVYLAGHIPNQDLVRYYQAADIYLSCSFSDGSSVTLMEALACGLPALVSDIPGNQEWIVPGEQGWLFQTGLAESLADAIHQALAQRRNWPTMKLAARQKAEQRADWKKNFKVLLEAYDQARHLKSGPTSVIL